MKEVWLLTVIIKNDVSRFVLLTYSIYDVIKPSVCMTSLSHRNYYFLLRIIKRFCLFPNLLVNMSRNLQN